MYWKKYETENDEMFDICEEIHKYVPGHQEGKDHMHQPVRTAFEDDYLTFEIKGKADLWN